MKSDEDEGEALADDSACEGPAGEGDSARDREVRRGLLLRGGVLMAWWCCC